MGKPLFLILSLLLHSFAESQTVSDIDGNVYPTISIGTQLWMAENLKVTRFNDGTPIPLVENNMQWFNLAFTSAMCYHFNDSAIGQDYGALYNWNVILNALNVCPTGWHVPTDSEWNTMAFYLDNTVDTSLAGAVGVGTDIGIQLKESGTAYWDVGNIGTNSSGFSAFGGGYRESNGDFEDLNNWGYWWTSTSAPQSKAYMRALNAQGPTIMRFVIDRLYGNSIRCISDNFTTQISSPEQNNEVLLYPNPASDQITLQYATKGSGARIYNAVGKLMMESNMNTGETVLDISSLPSGIYTIRTHFAGHVDIQRFVKQ